MSGYAPDRYLTSPASAEEVAEKGIGGRRRKILAGITSVGKLDPVLPTAVRLASSTGAQLHLVHVIEAQPSGPSASKPGVTAARGVGLSRYIDEVRSELIAHCRRLGCVELDLQVHTLLGSPHEEVTRLARELGVDLLMIGASGADGRWRNILGTTAERVLAHAQVPVLVLRTPFFGKVERVLITTDLSPLSGAVHEVGLDTVEKTFGPPLQCRSLFVQSILPESLWGSIPPAGEDLDKEEMDSFLAGRAGRSYPIHARVRTGRPPLEINVEADAWAADLIVMGTHGRLGLSRSAFGSVAASTIRDTSRNVLVIPVEAANWSVEGTPAVTAPAAMAATGKPGDRAASGAAREPTSRHR